MSLYKTFGLQLCTLGDLLLYLKKFKLLDNIPSHLGDDDTQLKKLYYYLLFLFYPKIIGYSH